jgi:3-dehydroquinate synthetase
MGLVAAARLGARRGVTDPALEGRIRAALERLGLPTSPPSGLDPAALAGAMAADKKRRAGMAAFVVPTEGGAALLEGLDPREAVEALQAAEASA